jgi:hypothetical protein
MPDPVDDGNEVAEILRSAAESMAKRANKPIVGATHCLCCDEPLEQDSAVPRRWCDSRCRDDWERQQR